MVKPTSIDVPLSDIISSKRNSFKKKGLKKPIRKVTGGIRKRGPTSNSGTPRRQSRGEERPRKFTTASPGHSDQRTVRLNISNLAGTVMSGDLQELFGKFKLRKVSVNFGEDGSPSGTGDIMLSKREADRLVHDFAGVALDDKVMHFAIIESNNNAVRQSDVRGTPNRRNFSGGQSNGRPRKKLVDRTPRSQKNASRPAKPIKKPKREPKPQKTAEELDAELDAYMSR